MTANKYSYHPGLVSLHAQDSTVNKSDVISVTLPSVAVTTTRNSPPVRHLYVTPQHTLSPCHQQVGMHNLGHHPRIRSCTSAHSPLLWPVVQPTCRPSVPPPLIPHISVTLLSHSLQSNLGLLCTHPSTVKCNPFHIKFLRGNIHVCQGCRGSRRQLDGSIPRPHLTW